MHHISNVASSLYIHLVLHWYQTMWPLKMKQLLQTLQLTCGLMAQNIQSEQVKSDLVDFRLHHLMSAEVKAQMYLFFSDLSSPFSHFSTLQMYFVALCREH